MLQTGARDIPLHYGMHLNEEEYVWWISRLDVATTSTERFTSSSLVVTTTIESSNSHFFTSARPNVADRCFPFVAVTSSVSVQMSVATESSGLDTERSAALKSESPATTTFTLDQPKSCSFIPQPCNNTAKMGSLCSISGTPCDMLQPCQNSATCNNSDTNPLGYLCICPSDINGTNCELDYRPCQLRPCWNNGRCTRSSSSLECSCIELL